MAEPIVPPVPPAEPPVAPPRDLFARIGRRARRRAEPRWSTAVAGGGCAVAVVGALLLGLSTGTSDSDFNQVPALLAALVVVGAGVAAQVYVRKGPLATAGTIAVVLGVPPLIGLATFERNLPPVSFDAVVVLSALAYVASYLFGPGRGRPAYLGAAAVAAWATVLQLFQGVFDLPFTVLAFVPGVFPSSGGSFEADLGSPSSFGPAGFGRSLPDPVTIGILSLGIGLAYLAASRWLDRRGHRGAATPVLVAVFPALVVGVEAVSTKLDGAVNGLLITGIGVLLAVHGASVGRRATTWIGGAAVALGAVTVVFDSADSASAAGGAMVTLGVLVVLLAHLVSTGQGEPDEMALTAEV